MKVLDIDTDGCVVCQDEENGEIYNCGETLEQFGIDNLTTEELNTLRERGKI